MRIAAVGGSVAAMSDWGGCLRKGYGVLVDMNRGNDGFMMVARRGDMDAEAVVRSRPGGIRTPDALKELFS